MSLTAIDRHMMDIGSAVEWLGRSLDQAETRSEKASARSAEFAAVVYRYMLEHPEATGRSELAEAYSRYMSAHAGNFGPGC